MPARIARSRTSAPPSRPKSHGGRNGKRSLDAYAAAQQAVPEKQVPRNRLGEILDDDDNDERRQKKRRRVDEDDGDEDDASGLETKRPFPSGRPNKSQNEDVEHGSDSSGNEWTLGGLGEDDNDSELDSDAAFGSSDEERFDGFTFRGSSSGRTKTKAKAKGSRLSSENRTETFNLDEESGSDSGDGDSDDDEGIGLGKDAVDLAAMLDDDDNDRPEIQSPGRRIRAAEKPSDHYDDESSEYDDTSESDADGEIEDGDNEEDEERVARMMDKLESYDSSRQPRISRTSDRVEENITLEDLLSGIDPATQKQFAGETNLGKKKLKPTTLSAPLPKRQQDRLNRTVASEKAKEQLTRWQDTVARNRRAEFLTFPLQSQSRQVDGTQNTKFAPPSQESRRTELENSIQQIMEESGLVWHPNHAGDNEVGPEESALLKSEELATNKIPLEEVMRRRAELRKTRELLFREEIKAKRIAKIKSKSYRRVHRKEREKLAEREREALEGLGAPSYTDQDEQDRKRAEARMSTKHNDSKWAKSLKSTNRTAWDEDARDSIIDMARKKEELQKRIAGHQVSDQEDSDFSSAEDEDAEELEESPLGQQLDAVQNQTGVHDHGLSGLKFMRAADERRREANNREIQALRAEVIDENGIAHNEEPDDRSLGRAIFGPQAKQNMPIEYDKTDRVQFEAPEASDDEAVTEKTGANATSSARKPIQQAQTRTRYIHQTELSSAKDPSAHKTTKRVEGTPSDPKKGGWLADSRADRRSRPDADDTVDLIITGVNTNTPAILDRRVQPEFSSRGASNGKPEHVSGQSGADLLEPDMDTDAEEGSDQEGRGQNEQKSLQQRAFAGDDVEVAFEAEKADLAASEDEKEVSTHLPGWGSWTGDGLSKSIRKANQRAKHNPLFKTKVAGGVKQADRKDTVLKNVIISEKHDRKGAKYLAPMLPHEFETKEQYERSRRLPMGPEWTTKEVNQRMTRPRVVVRPGMRMEALRTPLV